MVEILPNQQPIVNIEYEYVHVTYLFSNEIERTTCTLERKKPIRNQIIYGHPLLRRIMYKFQISNHLTFIYQNVEISFYDAAPKIIPHETCNGFTMDGANPNSVEIRGSCLLNFAYTTHI